MTFLKLKGATLNKIKLLTSPILQNIFGVPEEKILDISLTSAFFRLLFSSLTLIWANCLPFYLLIIYMNQNHFFSYDFFLDGIFGMKTFIATAAIAMIFISLAMYGWLIFAKLGFTQTRRNKKNSYRSLTWFFLLISIFFHTLILNLAFESSNIRAAVTILTISFLFIIIILPFVGHNVSQNIQNWKPFLFFILMSIAIPALNQEYTSDAVSAALRNFNIGGNKNIKIESINTKSQDTTEGILKLLSPNNIYMKENEKITIIPLSENTKITIW